MRAARQKELWFDKSCHSLRQDVTSLSEKVLQHPHTHTHRIAHPTSRPQSLGKIKMGVQYGVGFVSPSQLLHQLIILWAGCAGRALFPPSSLTLSSTSLTPAHMWRVCPIFPALILSVSLFAHLTVDLLHLPFLFGKLAHGCFTHYDCNYFHPGLVTAAPTAGPHSSS